jgi:hypothetical protein
VGLVVRGFLGHLLVRVFAVQILEHGIDLAGRLDDLDF